MYFLKTYFYMPVHSEGREAGAICSGSQTQGGPKSTIEIKSEYLYVWGGGGSN